MTDFAMLDQVLDGLQDSKTEKTGEKNYYDSKPTDTNNL